MPTTLPTLTRTIDQAFVSTWYDIKPMAIDNILAARPVTAALKAMGCFKTQVGGEFLTETVKYQTQTATAIAKGDLLNTGEIELETMARWTWRYFHSHVQRSLQDDQKNSGPNRIKSLVETRLGDARESLSTKMEGRMLAAAVLAETGKEVQGLNDMVPPFADRATSTYGAIARSNDWWVPKYKQLVAPYEVNLVENMRNLFNTISANQESPNLLISDQALYEMYEGFAVDASQIVKDTGSQLADLGFDVMKFKGKTWIWTSDMTANNMLMLNTNYIKVMYDPGLWFDMSDWKDVPNQAERIAHIFCTMNIISNQLRRHGRLYA